MEAIPKYVAWQLCAEIMEQNRGKWYKLDGLRCYACWRASPASPADRQVSRQDDYRGCELVNQEYACQIQHIHRN